MATPLQIDITNLKSREIIEVLSLYPYGHLEIKSESVLWISDYIKPSLDDKPDLINSLGAERNAPRRNASGMQDVNKRLRKMTDVLGSMI